MGYDSQETAQDKIGPDKGGVGTQYLIQPAEVFVVPRCVLTVRINQHVNVNQDNAAAPSNQARQRRRRDPRRGIGLFPRKSARSRAGSSLYGAAWQAFLAARRRSAW